MKAPKGETVGLEAFLTQHKLNAERLAEMAGVTPGLISRMRRAPKRDYRVEQVSKSKVRLWEHTGSPWRAIVTKDSAPLKWRKSAA